MSGIHRHLLEREYWASENALGLQAPNRNHNLRTYFTSEGIRVVDREDPEGSDLLGLRFEAWGREGALVGVRGGRLEHEKARVEIHRAGLVEWFVNGPDGLEHGFTIDTRPDGSGALVLSLATDGASARLSGDSVRLDTQMSRSLRYAKLAAWDANGRVLETRFDVPTPNLVRVVVSDEGARYPLTVDPLLTEAADTQFESDQVSAHLGYSVSSAGDVNGDGYADVIVGANGYDAGEISEGAAFIFLGGSTGIGDGGPVSASTQLESDQVGGTLGDSVSSAGDVNGDGYADVIVGAVGFDAGESNEGAAFVFLGSASGIADGTPSTAHAQLESDQAGAAFGHSVSSAGDVNGDGYADVIVGSRLYDAGEPDEGAAFVFLGGALGIADGNPTTAHAQLESDQDTALFGFSVASAGDVNGDGYADVIVGARLYDDLHTNEGAAFVFLGSASGIADGDPSSAHAQLEANQASASLGSSVSSAGDVNGDGYSDVIVGANVYSAGHGGEGAAFVFLGGASGIANGDPTSAHAQLESDQNDANMGTSVASAGDVNGDGYADVIVGAYRYDSGETDEGAAFVFLGSATGLADGDPTTAYAQLESDQATSYFGFSVSSAGDVNGDGYADVISGAFFFDAGEVNEGAAFVYLGASAGILDGNPSAAPTFIEGDLFIPDTAARTGASVAGAGDVNGDGYSDVIVGSPLKDFSHTNEGTANIYYGSTSGIPSGNLSTGRIEPNQDSALFGASVDGAGDVNGDGFADLIVGAPNFDNGEAEEGAAFIFLGSSSGIPLGTVTLDADTTLESNLTGGSGPDFGRSVAGAGDVNGDGFADVIVGAPDYENDTNNEGGAFVFLGSASGIPDGDLTSASTALEGNGLSANLGWSVSGAGDVNGDGYADVIVGAPYFDGAFVNQGKAMVFLGSASGILTTPATEIDSTQAQATLGLSVSDAGDVNGDGYGDVIIGAPLFDSGETDEGIALLYLGSSGGIASGDPTTADTTIESNQSTAELGFSVAGAGDVNGDGFADIIIGSRLYEAGEPGEGAAMVFLGSGLGIPDGDPNDADATIEGNQSPAQLGSAVAAAGDVNGDGFGDVIVGAPYYDAGSGQGEGIALVFHGGAGVNGRPVLVQQLRGDGPGTPILPWSKSFDDDAFEVRMTATHPEGRGRVKLEVEYCSEGLVFGDTGCGTQVSANWADVTATSGGVTLTESVTGLTTGSLYRWRARSLYAPFSVDESGITSPPNPAHGPWRRLSAQAREADVRILPEPHFPLSVLVGMATIAILGRRRSQGRTSSRR